MSDQLTAHDIEIILTSLEVARTQYEYAQFFTPELRERKLWDVDDVIAKLQALRDQMQGQSDPTAVE